MNHNICRNFLILDIYTWITFFLSLIYVILISKEKRCGFPFAFIASGIWAYTDFYIYNLKFDGFLQIFYALMAIYGWLTWSKGNEEALVVKRLRSKKLILYLLGAILISIFLVLILKEFTTTNLPYLDSFTTIYSIIATFLLIHKYIESWVILLFCNIIYIYIYSVQGAFPYTIMMAIYSIMAVYGFLSWKTSQMAYEKG